MVSNEFTQFREEAIHLNLFHAPYIEEMVEFRH